MEDLTKYVLLILLMLPFLVLATDALGKTQGRMIKTVLAVNAVSAVLALLAGGLHQRPNVANLIVAASFAWPVLLLAAKGYNPHLSWGFDLAVGLVASWFHMVIPSALLGGLLIGGRAAVRQIRGEQGVAPYRS